MVESPFSHVHTPLQAETCPPQMSQITPHWPEEMISSSSSLGAPGKRVSQMWPMRSLWETLRRKLPHTHEGAACPVADQQVATVPAVPAASVKLRTSASRRSAPSSAPASPAPSMRPRAVSCLRSSEAGNAWTCTSGAHAIPRSSGCSSPCCRNNWTCLGRACSNSRSTVSFLRAKMISAFSGTNSSGSSSSREKSRQPCSASKSTCTGRRHVGQRA
mmetsp:Transcript_12742/g.35250  ORF Transcript_12742/g.35250 Transcript_12742/m.35250 type:complete len:217 (+) Transcript_12742:231-881(+)